MKVRIAICVIAALLVFSGASPWEGAAAVAPEGELPATGRYIATNSFPANTIVDITNIENNRSTRVIVANNLNSPGLLAIVSREAAELIGMRPGSVSRIRMVQPSDPIAYLRFTEGINANIPDYDSGNVITEEQLLDELYRGDTYRPPSGGETQTAQADGTRGPSYTLEPEWRDGRRIIDLPGYIEYPPLERPQTAQPPVDETPSVTRPVEPAVETPRVTEQPQREIIKNVAEKIDETPRGEIIKNIPGYITEVPQSEAEKDIPGYIAEATISEADKDIPGYIAEVPRGEADKDIPGYIGEVPQSEAEKDIPGYIGEVPQSEAEKNIPGYITEAPQSEADKDIAEYLAEILRNEADKDVAIYTPESALTGLVPPPPAALDSPALAPMTAPERQTDITTAPPMTESERQVPPTTEPNRRFELNPTTERPPIYGIDLSEIFPDTPPAARPAVPVTPAVTETAFSIPPLSYLDRGWYYVQIASVDSIESVDNIIRQIDSRYEPKAYRDSNNRFCILLKPMNQGESAAVLQRFKSIGYRDAFVRRGS